MDGVRKKAKYLHDAPDGALMPGVGGHYPHMNGNRPVPIPSQDPQAVSGGQGGYYTQAPSTTYYATNSIPGHAPVSQEPAFSNPQAPISPPYSQTNHNAVATNPNTVSQASSSQMHQFGGPLFDPSDPALFNFDISSLNFGNHYGALELGMLGHMSAGAGDAHANDTTMNPLNQAAHLYNPQMSSATYENHGLPTNMPFGPDGLPTAEWQNAHSRHGSIQIQTPNNTPVTTTIDHANNRHDSLNGPHAYAIGQGPSSLSSASPASTDVNSGYENDNPLSAAAFFANPSQPHPQHSPTVNRTQQENRLPGGPLRPLQPNAIRKRRRDYKAIYEGIREPHNYTRAFHELFNLIKRRYSGASRKRAITALGVFRPILLSMAEELTRDDLVYTEKNLQRSLITLQENYAEVGVPYLICRRSGEIVGMNKEFEILTGWRRDILLGQVPNLNANMGPSDGDRANDSSLSTQTNTTPLMAGQEPDNTLHPVNVIELMDEPSSLQYLEDFADLAYGDALGKGHRRANLLRYLTKEDMGRMGETAQNGKPLKHELPVKLEDGSIHQGEAAMRNLSANGLIDCMIMWHIKRDNFDMPLLVTIHVSAPYPSHSHADR